MEKEFVSYEIAIALKELGFDEPCLNRFYTKPQSKMFGVDEKSRHYPIKNTSKKLYTMGEHFVLNDSNVILAPTFSQAFRWFREEYYLPSCLEPYIQTKKDWEDELVYFPKIYTLEGIITLELNVYEEAELDCLIKLIEIVKEQK
jgi:hypothetical protein